VIYNEFIIDSIYTAFKTWVYRALSWHVSRC